MTEALSPSARIAMALAQFGGDVSLLHRQQALTELIAAKHLPKFADAPAIALGRAALLKDAIGHAEPAGRLLAIAETVRLAQVVKRWAPDLIRDLAPAFHEPLPPLVLLSEADDRLNLARACVQMSSDWLPDYLARSVVEEEQGEKARAVLIDALLARSAHLAEAIDRLARHADALRPATEAPGDSLARRLTRMLSALRTAVVDSEREAGDGLGQALHKLVSAPLVNVGRPADDKVKLELSREAVLCVHDIVRTRMSVVAEPSIYLVVGYCRQLCGGGSWPDELRKPLDRLVSDVSEALVLLGRQGQCDQSLLAQLEVLCNHPERARAIARELSAHHPELPEEVRGWLEHGRLRPTRTLSSAATDASAGNADASIGLALQAARQARQAGEGLRDQLVSVLEMYEPALVSATEACLNQATVVGVQMEQVAGLRGLGLHGVIGEEIVFSAKFFEAIGTNPRQLMRVKQPAVVKLRADGTVGDVVLKGLAE